MNYKCSLCPYRPHRSCSISSTDQYWFSELGMYKLRKGDFFLLGAYRLVGGMDEFGAGCPSPHHHHQKHRDCESLYAGSSFYEVTQRIGVEY